MESIINGIIMIVIGAVGLAIGYLAPHASTVLTAVSSNSAIKNWVVYFIKYAQEKISKDGQEKMNWVVANLSDMCKKSGINITDEQLRVLSEGVYNEISKELKKIKYEGE